MASTEEETRFPRRFAYLQMTLLEATYFSANAISLGFLFFTGVGLWLYVYLRSAWET